MQALVAAGVQVERVGGTTAQETKARSGSPSSRPTETRPPIRTG